MCLPLRCLGPSHSLQRTRLSSLCVVILHLRPRIAFAPESLSRSIPAMASPSSQDFIDALAAQIGLSPPAAPDVVHDIPRGATPPVEPGAAPGTPADGTVTPRLFADEVAMSPGAASCAAHAAAPPSTPKADIDGEYNGHVQDPGASSGLRREPEWQAWEAPLLKRLRTEGDGLDHIFVEEVPTPLTFLATLESRKEQLSGKYGNWHVMSPVMQHALLVLEE